MEPESSAVVRRVLDKILSLALIFSLSTACTTLGSRNAKDQVVFKAPAGLAGEFRLNVGILPFNPGLPETGGNVPKGVSPGIRRAEAYYLPCLLRQTLARSDQWGDVSVAPRQSDALELTIEGEILKSDGDQLVVKMEARDATRRVWLRKRYRTGTRDEDYYVDSFVDPYERLFNTFANDLVEVRRKLPPEHISTLRQVAEIRFAEEFSPEAFQGYLEPDDKGQLELVRLPAHEDPMLERVVEARGREAMFIDTLNGHYENMCGGMSQSYLQWRESLRSETILERQANRRKAANIVLIPIVAVLLLLVVVASAYGGAASGTDTSATTATLGLLGGVAIAELAKNAQRHGAEADLHRATVEELETSFEGEVEPMVVEVQGVTRELTGSVDEQYEEWRRLLKEIYEAETGTVSGVSVPPALHAAGSRLRIKDERT